jgi:hypothetical protein
MTKWVVKIAVGGTVTEISVNADTPSQAESIALGMLPGGQILGVKKGQ